MPYVTSFERFGIEKGLEQGLQKGKIEGKREGVVEGKRAVAKNMLASGFDSDTIKKLTGISISQLKRRKPVAVK